MEEMQNLTKHKNTLKILNKVRCYMNIITLADISIRNGNTIDERAMKAQHPYPSKLHWPTITKPTIKEQQTWKCCPTISGPNSKKKHVPMFETLGAPSVR